uniref:BAR domain-containing protein n=1 Tax=Parascaris equorum TaxID=6256 RepID=A0A914R3D1_PAREQ
YCFNLSLDFVTLCDFYWLFKHHRTKLKGRRLDYDCKKRKQTRDEELIQAEEKLEESKRLAEQAMYNLLSNDVEQVSQLCALVDAQLDFHRQTTQVLERLQQQLRERVNDVNSRPRTEHIVKPVLADRTPSTRLVVYVFHCEPVF